MRRSLRRSLRNGRVSTKVAGEVFGGDAPGLGAGDHGGADTHIAVHGATQAGGDEYFPKERWPVESTCTEAGKKCEEWGAAERNCYGPTTTCHSPSPALRGRESPQVSSVQSVVISHSHWFQRM